VVQKASGWGEERKRHTIKWMEKTLVLSCHSLRGVGAALPWRWKWQRHQRNLLLYNMERISTIEVASPCSKWDKASQRVRPFHGRWRREEMKCTYTKGHRRELQLTEGGEQALTIYTWVGFSYQISTLLTCKERHEKWIWWTMLVTFRKISWKGNEFWKMKTTHVYFIANCLSRCL
jgi:hypothetical protein